MKSILLPYLTKNINNDWNSSVVFYNNSDKQSLIHIIYKSNTSEFSQTQIIESHSRWIFTPNNEGMFSLRCLVSDDVYVSGLIFGSGGLTTADQKEISTVPSSSQGIILVSNNTELYSLNGNPSCRYIQKRYFDCTKIAMFNYQNENIDSYKTSILDICPIIGTCPNHPGQSHSSVGNAIDIEYYKIDNLLPFNHSTNFDVARQWGLFSDLIALNKNVYFHISDLIKAPLLSYLSGRTDDINLLHSYTHVDIGTTYNHHLHVHVMWRS